MLQYLSIFKVIEPSNRHDTSYASAVAQPWWPAPSLQYLDQQIKLPLSAGVAAHTAKQGARGHAARTQLARAVCCCTPHSINPGIGR